MNETLTIVALTYWFYIGQLDMMYFLYKGIQRRLKHYDSDWSFDELRLVDQVMLIGFVCVDWWVNMTSLTIRFYELPDHPLQIMTERLQNWRDRYNGKGPVELTIIQWHRRVFADEVCFVLDTHSPHGEHC